MALTKLLPEVAEQYREYRFRQLVPISHEDYLDEPTANVDWFPAFANMEARLQQKAHERAAREAS